MIDFEIVYPEPRPPERPKTKVKLYLSSDGRLHLMVCETSIASVSCRTGIMRRTTLTDHDIKKLTGLAFGEDGRIQLED